MAISITTHGRYLTQIEKSTILFPINCYLVREDDGLTLVDTNWTKTADAILAAAEQLGAPIRRIALTHVHGDHVGSLDPLHQALPDADVLVGAREAGCWRATSASTRMKLRRSHAATIHPS